jgi:hypothetical protein
MARVVWTVRDRLVRRTHDRDDARRMVGHVDNRLTAQEAVELADHYIAHAAHRLETGADGRHYDPRFYNRVCTARAQLKPAVELGRPEHDHPALDDSQSPTWGGADGVTSPARENAADRRYRGLAA